jgi:accessory gene regulator protein AgrB
MGFTSVDWINLIALLLSVVGTFVMFFYSPVVSSQVFLYRKIEMQNIKKRDNNKNKKIRFGLLLILIACLLQAIAIFLNIASK